MGSAPIKLTTARQFVHWTEWCVDTFSKQSGHRSNPLLSIKSCEDSKNIILHSELSHCANFLKPVSFIAIVKPHILTTANVIF